MLAKILFRTIVLLFLSSTAFAQTAALNSLDKLLSSWKTLSADFTQQVFTGDGQGQEMYRGKLYLSKPNRFRWIITQPEPQVVVADGKNLWVYDEELEQASVQPLSQQLSETPALFLSGEFTQITQVFNVSELKGTDQRFLITPKKEDNLLQQMVLTFNKQNQLTHMQIKDALGQTTELTFTNVKINPNLAKDLFIFTPPKNADVVGEPL
jgi:outer membrane lipoprotein carrier protein